MKLFEISRERFEVVHADITDGSEPALRFYILVAVSTLIAAFGLILDSTAVVIGAMLVAPLMTPILAIAAAVVGVVNHRGEIFTVLDFSRLSGIGEGTEGTVAVLLKSELLLFIVGGMFVLEVLSVILQTSVFKYTRIRTGTGRRVFRMAPLHHHFEQLGWPETRVVIRFYILAIIFALTGLATMKVR